MERLVLDSKMARWVSTLAAYDLKFVQRKALKGGAIADQLAEFPVEDEVRDQGFPKKEILGIENSVWEMYFDGASNHHGNGIGVVFITPCGEHIPFSVKLDFQCTNNEAEYEACINGLEAALELGIKKLKVFGDSILIVPQAVRKLKIREERLVPYLECLHEVANQFGELSFEYLPRAKNQFADALATLASMVDIQEERIIQPLNIRLQKQPAHILNLVNDKPWFWDILKYLRDTEYLEGSTKADQRTLRQLATGYLLLGGILYKRSWNGMHLRCVDELEAQDLMETVHGGEEGPHMYGLALARKIANMGYYWTTMNADCARFVQKCHQCQVFAKLQKQPPLPLHPITSPWPFATWGIDVIGSIHPKASNGHQFILVAVDYFTKWIEAASYSSLNAKKVVHFVRTNILCRYGTPFEVITDNGPHFQGEFAEFLQKKRIQHHRSSPYRPQTNGAVEAANKSIKTILQKMIEEHRGWNEKLPLALWDYRTSVRTPTGATPYSLVYGMEAVLPIELKVQSARVIQEAQISETEWTKGYHQALLGLEERRLQALHQVQAYQRRISRAFNRRVKDRKLVEGCLVLKEIRAPIQDPRGKFRPHWAGPYFLKKIISEGAVILSDLDELEFRNLCNLDQLKRYYV